MNNKKITYILLRKFFFFIVIPFIGVHFLLTGFPVPIIIIKSLKKPIQIKKIEPNYLLSIKEQKIILPYISELPTTNIVFHEALSRGVEVDKHGNVYGLIKISHSTGSSAVRYHIQRINLSALVITLDPDLINIPTNLFTNIKMAEHSLNAARSRYQIINSYSKQGWKNSNLYRLKNIERYCFPDTHNLMEVCE